ncbi:PTS transporter subunit EIIC [Cytobacillus oceanisediminis]|uniref:PTS transporter subunit EIIC n=1 Tax=Cytobacillus oceanisediminis TaxID=665099 RepID=UPI001CCE7AEE|nr:PTS transporter subunit EIIC [Cytobacillus oceanisediminis]MBQ6448484.1 PTS transporter subunit EIIC [Bacillus sp. (in: firmicutes)]MBZ9534123.1 PTS transporter subunit EIIC [Cytobacillus oceanisediminis]
MDYSSLAKQLISEVGGKENIRNVTHCMTRLRFVLKDDKVPNTKNVKQIPGVLGVTISGGQYQVIIGTEVSKAYDKVCEILGIQEQQTPEEIIDDNEKAGLFNRFFKLISGIIFPVMGVMAAVGIMKGLLAGLTSFNLLSTENGTYQILYAFADGFFYFLPIILGFSAAVKFKSNPYIGATIGAALVYPNIVTLYNEGTNITFMKIPVVLTSYGNSVFPIIAAVALAAYVERRVKKVVPSSVQLFLTPFITLSITVPLTFLVIGPIMTYISDILASSTQAIYGFSPIITGIILGAFWQLVVIFGLHYAFIPILINNIATMGEDPINAILNVTVFALAGAAIGFALKQKDKVKRSLGFSTGLTGLFGVTEPIIYGIALPYKKPFIAAFIGGGIAGGITAAMNAKMFGFGGNALFAAPLFINPEGIDVSFTAYLIASTIAFFVPLLLTYLFVSRDDELVK